MRCAEGYARFAHHITLENLIIVNHGQGRRLSAFPPASGVELGDPRQTALSVPAPACIWQFDGAPFIAGLIEHNLIAGSIGYNLQIKHQAPRPELPGMPQRGKPYAYPSQCADQDRNSSGGADARPLCWSATGRCRGRARKTGTRFYGNFFTRIRPRRCFRARAIWLSNNLLVNDQGDGCISSRTTMYRPHRGVSANTVLARGNGIRVHGGLVPPGSRSDRGECGVRRTAAERRRAGAESDCCAQRASVYLTAPDAPLGRLRLDPAPGRLLAPGTGLEWIDEFSDAERDYDGAASAWLIAAHVAKTALVAVAARAQAVAAQSLTLCAGSG